MLGFERLSRMEPDSSDHEKLSVTATTSAGPLVIETPSQQIGKCVAGVVALLAKPHEPQGNRDHIQGPVPEGLADDQ